jgi:four helix bundle protein
MSDAISNGEPRTTPKSYKDLEMYQLAHAIGVGIHRFSFQLPKHEMYEMGSRPRRSSMPISANIVEGYERRHYKSDLIKYLSYARASCDETKEWLEYIPDCHPALEAEASRWLLQAERVGCMLHRFMQSVALKHLSER